MPLYKQGDIVLLPFPFTDLTQSKNRPAIIVAQKASRNNDFIVAKITSNIHRDSESFLLNTSDIIGTLPAISEVRCNELMTIAQRRIIKKYATLEKEPLKTLCDKIKRNFDVE